MNLRTLAAFVVAVLVLAGCGVATAQPNTTLEENAFAWASGTGSNPPATQIVADANASGGSVMRVTQDVAVGTVQLPAGTVSSVTVRARGVQYLDVWPILRVTLNGAVIATHTVNTTGYADYSVAVAAPAGVLQVALTNQYCGHWWIDYLCNRHLFIDRAVVTLDGGGTTTPTTTTTTTTTPPPATVEYVAMGDSYSSGWGANRTPTGVDPTATIGNCGRVNKAAQVLLAAERNWTLKNVACGGSTVANNVAGGSNAGEGPQLNAVTAATDVVTMTIGGNDTGLLWILDQCVRTASWLCWGGISGASIEQQFADKAAALGPALDNVLRTIVQRNPAVKVRAAGYPYIVPPENFPKCSWMTTEEQVKFAEFHRRTNNAIKASAQRIAAETGADVQYVDPLAPTSPFMQLDASGQLGVTCAGPGQVNADRYMIGVEEVPLADGGWHPFREGQEHYRDLYAASLP